MKVDRIAKDLLLGNNSKKYTPVKGGVSKDNLNTIMDILDFVSIIVREKPINFEPLKKLIMDNGMQFFLYNDKDAVMRFFIVEVEQDKTVPLEVSNPLSFKDDYNVSSNHGLAAEVVIHIGTKVLSTGLDLGYVNVINMHKEDKIISRTSEMLTGKIIDIQFTDNGRLEVDMNLINVKTKMAGSTKYHQAFIRLYNRDFDKEKCLLIPAVFLSDEKLPTPTKRLS